MMNWTVDLRRAAVRLAMVACACALFISGSAVAQTGRPELVIEADSGRVLHAAHASTPWYPASLTKLMTVYVVFDAIRNGEITLDTPLVYSQEAAATPPAKMGFKPGTIVTVDNALKMMVVRSSNDVTVMVAENLAGSVSAFVTRMNTTARRLGMTGSRFINPHGLPGEGQVTTARDMAVLARALYREFPQHSDLFRIGAIQFGGKTLPSYNMLIGRYPGAEGMKTGYIRASGFNLVGSATRNGRRLIAVVMGTESGRARAEKAAELLEKGFASWGLFAGRQTVAELPSSIGTPVNIWPEIVAQRKAAGASANAGENDGLESGDNASRSLLKQNAESVVRVAVFVGPNPARPDIAPPASAAAIASISGPQVPMPQPRPASLTAAAAAPHSAKEAQAPLALRAEEPAPEPLADALRPAVDPLEIASDIRAFMKGERRLPSPPPPGTDMPATAVATTPDIAHPSATTPQGPVPQQP